MCKYLQALCQAKWLISLGGDLWRTAQVLLFASLYAWACSYGAGVDIIALLRMTREAPIAPGW